MHAAGLALPALKYGVYMGGVNGVCCVCGSYWLRHVTEIVDSHVMSSLE